MPPRPGRSSASLLVRLLGAAALCAASLAVCLPARAQEVAVIQVRLPDPLSPAARSVKYTEPLDGALRREGLGRVLGGSTELSRDRRIVSVGMEIEEVERVWAPIAETDDWAALDAKIASVRALGERLGPSAALSM